MFKDPVTVLSALYSCCVHVLEVVQYWFRLISSHNISVIDSKVTEVFMKGR